ncbi:MAG TPA: cell wall-binding repeat-containing protein [Acidimicrobiales bacterium]|nr:cell wall-binding repeat-containing protein [Acidimicrobiales bacterium]
MNTTLHRLRTWVVTAIAATTLLSTGVILASGGSAGAAVTGASLTGVTQPTILSRPALATNNQAVGNLTIALAGGSVTATQTLTVTAESNTGQPLNWDGVPTFTVAAPIGSQQLCVEGVASGPGCPAAGTAPTIAGNVLTFLVTTGTGAFPVTIPNGETITLSTVHYDVPAGTTVGPDFNTAAVTVGQTGLVIAPNTHVLGPGAAADGSTNAIISNAAAAPTLTLNAVTTPGLAIGGANQTGGNWNLTLLKNPAPGTSIISAGDKIHVVVADNAGNNCNPGTLADPDSIGFVGTPAINITAGSGSATAVPTATIATSAVNDGANILCAGSGVNNALTITFTNATPVVLTNPGLDAGINIQITGVKYNVSGGATISADQGNLDVGSNYDINGFGLLPLPGAFSTAGAGPTVATSGPSDGDIGAITVLGNTPPADIQLNVTSIAGSGSEAVNQPISPITIAESSTGALPSGANGFVCVSLLEGAEWDGASAVPTAAATNGMTVGPVSIETSGPLAGDSDFVFQVTGGSSTGPATITLSNLHVSVPQSLVQDVLGGFVTVTYGGTDAACNGGVTTTTATKAFSVSGRIFGSNADATAAQSFAIANPAAGGGNLNAVIATDTDPYDALSATYLAGQLSTGILLTPTAAISSETLNAIRIAGVETVYVMGGADAVSGAAISQLESTPSYFPGGTTQRHDAFTNDSRLLTVQQIFGSTADGTASQAAQFVGDFPIGNPAFQAGYGGQYNDTAGSSGSSVSSAPDLGVQTAIVATDTGFQDAASASVMAYHNNLPLVLTPPAALSSDAAAALQNDGIQQAIVMGGQDAISDAVVTQLEGMGISVLRIAGSDYTDTSAKAAEFEINNTNAAGQFDGLGYSTTNALGAPVGLNLAVQSLSFARGDFYTDSLVSAQINSLLESPELLSVDPNTLGTPVTTFLATEGVPATAFGQTHAIGPGFSVNQFHVVGGQAIFGGPVAFTSALETAIATAIGPDQLPIP